MRKNFKYNVACPEHSIYIGICQELFGLNTSWKKIVKDTAMQKIVREVFPFVQTWNAAPVICPSDKEIFEQIESKLNIQIEVFTPHPIDAKVGDCIYSAKIPQFDKPTIRLLYLERQRHYCVIKDLDQVVFLLLWLSQYYILF